jgi:hypothetical protein
VWMWVLIGGLDPGARTLVGTGVWVWMWMWMWGAGRVFLAVVEGPFVCNGQDYQDWSVRYHPVLEGVSYM